MQLCVHEPGKYNLVDESINTRLLSTVEQKFVDNPSTLNKKTWNPDFGPVTWRLDTDTQDIAGKKLQIKLFKRIFLQPSILTSLIIRQKRRAQSEADIVITFTHDDAMFFKRPSVLAYAYGPQVGIGGDITFNDNYLWSLDGKPLDADAYTRITGKEVENPDNSFRTYDALHTGGHEGGHALGMPHITDCPHCMMFPTYNGERLYQQGDLELFYSFYQQANINQRIKENLLGRILNFH